MKRSGKSPSARGGQGNGRGEGAPGMGRRKQCAGAWGVGRQLAAVLLCALAVGFAPSARAAETGFPDVPETAWYAESIRRIQEEAPGTVSGMEDGTFRPSGSTTRAQFAKMLCAFSGEAAAPDFQDVYGGPSAFSDVSGWAAPYVSWAAEQGLVEGTGSGRFSPEAPLTREQLAVLLYRYAGQWDAVELRFSETALSPFLTDGRSLPGPGKP